MLLRSLTKHVKDQNWFAVGLDFVIVVLGVLLAFQFSNWNEARRAKANYERALVDLRADISSAYFASAERISLQDCRRQRYRELGTLLRRMDEPWPGSVGPYSKSTLRSEDFPPVVRSSSRYFVSQIWRTEADRGAFDLMDAEMRQEFSAAYLQGAQAEELQGRITRLEARLQALAYPLDLSVSDRLHYYEVLSELDQVSLLMEVIAMQLTDRFERIGMHLPESDEDKEELRNSMIDLMEQSREVYGDCVKPLVWPGLLEQEADRP